MTKKKSRRRSSARNVRRKRRSRSRSHSRYRRTRVSPQKHTVPLRRYRCSESNFLAGIEIELCPYLEYNGKHYAVTVPNTTGRLAHQGEMTSDDWYVFQLIESLSAGEHWEELSTWVDGRMWEIRTTYSNDVNQIINDMNEKIAKLQSLLSSRLPSPLTIWPEWSKVPKSLWNFDDRTEIFFDGLRTHIDCVEMVTEVAKVQFNFTLSCPASSSPPIIDRSKDLNVIKILQYLEPVLIPRFGRRLDIKWKFGSVPIDTTFYTIPLLSSSLQESVEYHSEELSRHVENDALETIVRNLYGHADVEPDFRYAPSRRFHDMSNTPAMGFACEVRFTGHVDRSDIGTFITFVHSILQFTTNYPQAISKLGVGENDYLTFVRACVTALQDPKQDYTDYFELLEERTGIKINGPFSTAFDSVLQHFILKNTVF